MDGKGKILYSLVARGRVVLAEYTSTSGNFPTVTRMLLNKIPSNTDSKMSYKYDTHVFHYIVESEITYLCMADASFKRRLPFAFLDDIKERFKGQYGEQARSAIAFAMNEEFSRVLQRQMDYFNGNPQADAVGRVQNQLAEVKDVAMKNIEKVLERGEKIELLVDKTDRMKNTAVKFQKTSRNLKNAQWWNNMKMWLVIILIAAVVILFIAALACGGIDFHGCAGSSTPAPRPSSLTLSN